MVNFRGSISQTLRDLGDETYAQFYSGSCGCGMRTNSRRAPTGSIYLLMARLGVSLPANKWSGGHGFSMSMIG